MSRQPRAAGKVDMWSLSVCSKDKDEKGAEGRGLLLLQPGCSSSLYSARCLGRDSVFMALP